MNTATVTPSQSAQMIVTLEDKSKAADIRKALMMIRGIASVRMARISDDYGTSAQRSRWLKKGLTTGDVSLGDTFSPAYSAL